MAKVEVPRSVAARRAAEAALVRVVHHYGEIPEFVVLGGLVPELLCSKSEFVHAGTTDIDVQVNLEIACGSTNTKRLERALRNADFLPTANGIWRWLSTSPVRPKIEVKFELLADQDDIASQQTIKFSDCQDLGAMNLRGTRFAAEDSVITNVRAKIGGTDHEVKIKVTSVAGFLLAKAAAAHARCKAKDWYDIAFVLLHNDLGGVEAAANEVLRKFGDRLPEMTLTFAELAANFDNPIGCQGPEAYADQLLENHPDEDRAAALASAVTAVQAFCNVLYPNQI